MWRSYGITVRETTHDIQHGAGLYLVDRKGFERVGYLFPFEPGFVARDIRTLARRRMTAPGPWLRLTALAAAAGSLLTVVSGSVAPGTAHRTLAVIALPPLAALVAAGWLEHRRLLVPSAVALVLFGAAALSTGSKALHVALAAAALAATLVAAASGLRGERVPNGPWRDYVTLTKPRIMSLLLVTGACGMIVGAHGWPGTQAFLLAMLGLALACGGASALNHMLDADIDRLMGSRTERRPVAAGRVPAPRALEFGLALSALSFVLLASTVNVLTAALALVGNLFYVLVYTRLLKRSTPRTSSSAARRAPSRRSSAGLRRPATSACRRSGCS